MESLGQSAKCSMTPAVPQQLGVDSPRRPGSSAITRTLSADGDTTATAWHRKRPPCALRPEAGAQTGAAARLGQLALAPPRPRFLGHEIEIPNPPILLAAPA